MSHREKNRGHRTSKIVKSTQSYSNGHLRYFCSLYYLARASARCMTWRLNFVRSKDAQKQWPRTSLIHHWNPEGSNRTLKTIFKLIFARYDWSLQLYTHSLNSCKIKAWNNSGLLNGIRTHDLYDTGAVLMGSQRSWVQVPFFSGFNFRIA